MMIVTSLFESEFSLIHDPQKGICNSGTRRQFADTSLHAIFTLQLQLQLIEIVQKGGAFDWKIEN